VLVHEQFIAEINNKTGGSKAYTELETCNDRTEHALGCRQNKIEPMLPYWDNRRANARPSEESR